MIGNLGLTEAHATSEQRDLVKKYVNKALQGEEKKQETVDAKKQKPETQPVTQEAPEAAKTAGPLEEAREFFNSRGELRHIKKLEFWPIANVLKDKYGFPKESAAEVASFLNPMLCFDPERRVKAADALQHPFLRQQPEESGRKESPILITT